MIVNITEEDIRNGVAQSCYQCPVALASARTFNVQLAWVSYRKVFVPNEDGSVAWGLDGQRADCYELPKEAIDFIIQFDDRKEMKPFSFELGEPVNEVVVG